VVVDFIDEYRGRFGVEPICRVLSRNGVKIAPSTYYAARKRPPSPRAILDAHREEIIETVFHDARKGRGVAGVRKMWHYLKRDGHQIPRCTVERLMRKLGLKGVVRGGYKMVTTKADPRAHRPPDLVNRDFRAHRPNALWVVDFTYVPTWDKVGFTAFVQDVYSRRLVGWRVADTMPTELPLDALEMALWVREQGGHNVEGVIHHSDAGSQYTAIRYANRLHEAGALASIGTVGDSYDNSMAETLHGQYKAECVKRDGPFRTVGALELATCAWVDYYNRYRVHSALGYLTPIEYETQYYGNPARQDQPV
jgi:putative transposase